MQETSTVKDYEVNRRQLFRKHQNGFQRFASVVHHYGWTILLALLLFSVLLPALAVIFAAVSLCIYLMVVRQKNSSKWLLREPGYISDKPIDDETGLLYLGNAKDEENKALWFSRGDLARHGLILGATGSGKTELMFTMMHQFAALGSGFIFCDGKAGVATWFSVYTMAKELGLEDNLTVINFLTPNKGDGESGTKISNTFNPFAFGSSDTLMEILSGLMGSTGNDSGMWRGRAEALGRCILRALCELRDQNELDLSVDTIRQFISLNKLEGLSKDNRLSSFTKSGITYYLSELPGYNAYKEALQEDSDAAKAAANDAKKTAYEQHSYLTMQFTKTLELLSGTYSHITKTDLSEVDFRDIIKNRRILYIMLPSLEKSPESLKDLGRMVVTSVRSALASLQGGDRLTGSKEVLLDAKPTQADIPYALFFDEYGSYAVEGFGDICAQARSINISAWFSGQEFDSFEKGSKIEASRILSNTGIKIFMKTEGKSTLDVANARAGQAYVYAANQVETRDESLSESTYESGTYSIQQVQRITMKELADQKPGQCHVLYGKYLWRVNSFYADFKLRNKSKLNQFIKIKKDRAEHVCSSLSADEWDGATSSAVHPDSMSKSLMSFIGNQKVTSRT